MDNKPLYACGIDMICQETGKNVDEWMNILKDWNGFEKGHTLMVNYLKKEYNLKEQWAHAVAVRCQRDEYMREQVKSS